MRSRVSKVKATLRPPYSQPAAAGAASAAAREPQRQHQAVGGQAPLATGLTPIMAKSWQP
jgi:hypothetical protein